MDLFEEAVMFATMAHAGAKRKSSDLPFIVHPMEAASIVGTMTEDREILAAAVLHDVVEDTPVSLDVIRKKFGDRVADLVSSETENKRKDRPSEDTWEIRKAESLEWLKNSKDIAVKMVWLGDKLANMRSFYRTYLIKGDSLWQAFHQKDPARQAWYYRLIVEALYDLKDYPAWTEYKDLVNKVFENY